MALGRDIGCKGLGSMLRELRSVKKTPRQNKPIGQHMTVCTSRDASPSTGPARLLSS